MKLLRHSWMEIFIGFSEWKKVREISNFSMHYYFAKWQEILSIEQKKNLNIKFLSK
jgi:hypothetical protein